MICQQENQHLDVRPKMSEVVTEFVSQADVSTLQENICGRKRRQLCEQGPHHTFCSAPSSPRLLA